MKTEGEVRKNTIGVDKNIESTGALPKASMPSHVCYEPFLDKIEVKLPDREWPNRRIFKAPMWCSVDLRDGNQALPEPMDLEKKLKFFDLLIQIGFRQIEIGFPSASSTEFEFARHLIENRNLKGVIPQVLTQARDHLIEKTFDAIEGSDSAIVHVYNSTSEQQRRIVFNMSEGAVVDLAVNAVRNIKERSKRTKSDIILEYSPESFTGTELPFAKRISEAVMEAWEPTPDRRMILNLPATVESSTPNVYADQIEWMRKNITDRESIIISLHPHNDRGTAIAATELGLLAGADRVEGTLFGNGERAGNVDTVVLALNLLTQGVDPELDFSNLPYIQYVYEECTGLGVHQRHPHGGEFSYVAFSGSHQDAINKGKKYEETNRTGERAEKYDIPYIPLNPEHIGREYEEGAIRINSQSGKGGIAYVLKRGGYGIPKEMAREAYAPVQKQAEQSGKELSKAKVVRIFEREFVNVSSPFKLIDFSRVDRVENVLTINAALETNDGKEIVLKGSGDGPLDAFKNALVQAKILPPFDIVSYEEKAEERGSASNAIAYIEIKIDENGTYWGVGKDRDSERAFVLALLSAVDRSVKGTNG